MAHEVAVANPDLPLYPNGFINWAEFETQFADTIEDQIEVQAPVELYERSSKEGLIVLNTSHTEPLLMAGIIQPRDLTRVDTQPTEAEGHTKTEFVLRIKPAEFAALEFGDNDDSLGIVSRCLQEQARNISVIGDFGMIQYYQKMLPPDEALTRISKQKRMLQAHLDQLRLIRNATELFEKNPAQTTKKRAKKIQEAQQRIEDIQAFLETEIGTTENPIDREGEVADI